MDSKKLRYSLLMLIGIIASVVIARFAMRDDEAKGQGVPRCVRDEAQQGDSCAVHAGAGAGVLKQPALRKNRS